MTPHPLNSTEVLNLVNLLEEAREEDGRSYIADAEEDKARGHYIRQIFGLGFISTSLCALVGFGQHVLMNSTGFSQWCAALWLTMMVLLVQIYRQLPRGRWTIASEGIEYRRNSSKAVYLNWSGIKRIKIANGWITLAGETDTLRFPDSALQPGTLWLEAAAVLRKRLRKYFDLATYEPPPNSILFRITSIFAHVLAGLVFFFGMILSWVNESKLHGWAGLVMITVTVILWGTVACFQDWLGLASYRRLNCAWRLPTKPNEELLIWRSGG